MLVQEARKNRAFAASFTSGRSLSRCRSEWYWGSRPEARAPGSRPPPSRRA
jgi:hypothetical protein